MPIEIIKEHAGWRQIQDIDGNSGWILGSLLKGDRYGIIISNSHKESKLFDFPQGKQIGIIGKNNIVKIKKCLTQWCLIQYQKNEGWIKKENIWGVYKNEIYKINFMEKGAIPLFHPSFKNDDKFINIGSAGGMTRLSTGYTFLNIQEAVYH